MSYGGKIVRSMRGGFTRCKILGKNTNDEFQLAENNSSINFSDYPKEHQLAAEKKLQYVRSIEGMVGETAKTELEKKAKELGDVDPPQLSTVHRWAAKLKKSDGSIRSLVSNFANCGNKKPRYPEEVRIIATRVICEFYLTPIRPTLRHTLSLIWNEIDAYNKNLPDNKKLPKPKRTFLVNLINSMNTDIDIRKSWKSNARVQIVQSELDILVVDKKTKLLRRPTITTAIGSFTGCILSYEIK